MSIGANVKYYRRLNNLSQEELAQKVGVTRAYISQIENGKGIPSEELLAGIAKNLNTAVTALNSVSPASPKERTILEILIAKTKDRTLKWEKYAKIKDVEKNYDIVFLALEKIEETNIDGKCFYYSRHPEKNILYTLYSHTDNSFLCVTYFDNLFPNIHDGKYFVEKSLVLDNPQIKYLLLDLTDSVEAIFDKKEETFLNEIVNDLIDI